MYVGPKKFVESDFVTKMRLKYEASSPKKKMVVDATLCLAGAVAGTAVVALAYVAGTKSISEETAED